MLNHSSFTLINPQNGNLAFKLFSFEDNFAFDHLQRNNYYSLIWIIEGSGKLKADFAEYDFASNSLCAFAPYQPFMLQTDKALKGVAINFHPDFFCIIKHHAEVACNGVLFNNMYDPPITLIDETGTQTLQMVVNQMIIEMQHPALAQYELLISYLKIFLITVSRLKSEQQPNVNAVTDGSKQPFILQTLKDVIERDYKTKHSPSDYAKTLNISTKALAKITKKHVNRTLSELISERIIIEAKRELYLTNKPVKEIAWQLGYEDEYYFSRFFKTNADVSPNIYRETVGFNRGVV